MPLSQLKKLRRQLESAVPGFEAWTEAQRLYGPVADLTPGASVEALVAQFDWGRPEAPVVFQVLLPHLPESSLEHVMNLAARMAQVELLAVGWLASSPNTRLNALRASASRQNTQLLDWVLECMSPSQFELQEALFSAVWQGSEATVDRLLPLVEEPWRIVDGLRKKGGPDRLLSILDTAWSKAVDGGNATVPDGRVLTSKFRSSLPLVSARAAQHRLSKRLKPASPTPSIFRPRF